MSKIDTRFSNLKPGSLSGIMMLASFIFLIAAGPVLSQSENVGIGTNSPDQSAILDLSSTSMGFLIPRMTELQRNGISNPATGLMIYQTNGFPRGVYYYDGSTWVNMLSGSDGPYLPLAGGTMNGILDLGNNDIWNINNLYVGGLAEVSSLNAGFVTSNALGRLSSVSAIDLSGSVTNELGVANGGTGLNTAPSNGQLLIGNGADFNLSTLTAGSGITITNGAGSIQIDAGFPTGTADGQTVRWNGSNWVANSVLFNDGANIGVGTTSLTRKFEVNGDFRLGQNGTTVNDMIKITETIDVANINAQVHRDVDISITNVTTGATVFVSPGSDLPDEIAIAYAYVPSNGTVRIRFINIGIQSRDPASMDYYITVIQ